jgi:hypothetical protein
MIDLLDFKMKITNRYIGRSLLKFNGLIMKCEVVYSAQNDRVWIRMPEVWFNKDIKTKFCWWESEETSKQFQKDVILQLEKRYNLKSYNFKQLLMDYCDEKKKTKKPIVK